MLLIMQTNVLRTCQQSNNLQIAMNYASQEGSTGQFNKFIKFSVWLGGMLSSKTNRTVLKKIIIQINTGIK